MKGIKLNIRDGLALLWLAIAIFLMSKIDLRTSNLDLVDPDNPVVAQYVAFSEKFGTPNPIVISLSGAKPADLRKTVDTLQPLLLGMEGVQSVKAVVPQEYQTLLRESGAEDNDLYMHDEQSKHYYVFIQLSDPFTRIDFLDRWVPPIRKTIDDVCQPLGIQHEWTGLPMYALDDRDIIQGDLLKASIISVILVIIIISLGFGSIKSTFAAALPMMAGILGCAGFSVLFPGYLTLMSSAAFSLLVGLGIDFSIHMLSRVDAAVHENSAMGRSLRRSMTSSALTSACVFFTMLTGPFRGFREFGLLCGVGILLLLFYFLRFYPRLLRRWPPRETAVADESRGSPVKGIYKVLLGICMSLSLLVAVYGFSKPTHFNGNYQDLQPLNSATVRCERQMMAESNWHPVFAAMSIHGQKNALRICENLRTHKKLVSDLHCLAELEELGPLPKIDGENLNSFFKAPDLYAIHVFPAIDVWNSEEVQEFNSLLRKYDENVTGMPVLGQAMTEWTREAFQQTGLVACLAVFLLVLLDFKNPLAAMLAALPTWLSAGWLLAVYHYLDIPFNPISVMAWPIIFGIAIDDGIHLTHYLLAGNSWRLSFKNPLCKAMILTSFSTMVAFGTLMLSQHRGLSSMSSLICLGMGMALIASLLVLPYAVSIFPQRILCPWVRREWASFFNSSVRSTP